MWSFKFMINFCIMLMLAFYMGQACSSLMVFMGILKGIWYVFTLYLDNNIIPIQGNHGHCPDGSTPTERSSHSIELTHQGTCNIVPIVTPESCNPVWYHIKILCTLLTQGPCFIVAVDDHNWWHAGHHSKVRKCKVNHKKVGWCSKRLGGGEDVYDHSIASNRDNTQHTNHKTK